MSLNGAGALFVFDLLGFFTYWSLKAWVRKKARSDLRIMDVKIRNGVYLGGGIYLTREIALALAQVPRDRERARQRTAFTARRREARGLLF